jgi:hypothetical protein
MLAARTRELALARRHIEQEHQSIELGVAG